MNTVPLSLEEARVALPKWWREGKTSFQCADARITIAHHDYDSYERLGITWLTKQ